MLETGRSAKWAEAFSGRRCGGRKKAPFIGGLDQKSWLRASCPSPFRPRIAGMGRPLQIKTERWKETWFEPEKN